eukprot:CAMPEP_0185693136 /NCGR_PEP_ID=MMETSP1164-20130828/3022_1 /TAXON_ID=1104430 /ORGANISM="Chrysoreinhardia sp, Strain CCMP2950" /LENGTH=134 /DNA_ID=CAMNT_0028359901 /DNA_START=215 /DNA_END=616 /DNA_ORIENTATION=-
MIQLVSTHKEGGRHGTAGGAPPRWGRAQDDARARCAALWYVCTHRVVDGSTPWSTVDVGYRPVGDAPSALVAAPTAGAAALARAVTRGARGAASSSGPRVVGASAVRRALRRAPWTDGGTDGSRRPRGGRAGRS